MKVIRLVSVRLQLCPGQRQAERGKRLIADKFDAGSKVD
jgi:hypothetical protein